MNRNNIFKIIAVALLLSQSAGYAAQPGRSLLGAPSAASASAAAAVARPGWECAICFNNRPQAQRNVTNCCTEQPICTPCANDIRARARAAYDQEEHKEDESIAREGLCPFCQGALLTKDAPQQVAPQAPMPRAERGGRRQAEQATFGCDICLEGELKAQDITQLACLHVACKGCLQGMVDVAIGDKSARTLKCPIPECRQALTPDDIRDALDRGDPRVGIITDIMKEESYFQDKNARHCPTPGCLIWLTNKEPQTITCKGCEKSYCSSCLLAHPHGQSCKEAKGNIDKANEEWKQEHTKPCPQCTADIEKDGGCIHMTCEQCLHEFCWECMGNWNTHYDNYDCNNPQPAAPRPGVQAPIVRAVAPTILGARPIVIPFTRPAPAQPNFIEQQRLREQELQRERALQAHARPAAAAAANVPDNFNFIEQQRRREQELQRDRARRLQAQQRTTDADNFDFVEQQHQREQGIQRERAQRLQAQQRAAAESLAQERAQQRREQQQEAERARVLAQQRAQQQALNRAPVAQPARVAQPAPVAQPQRPAQPAAAPKVLSREEKKAAWIAHYNK